MKVTTDFLKGYAILFGIFFVGGAAVAVIAHLL
jgi:hypothetical protein